MTRLSFFSFSLQMLLQATEMQMDVLEARVQAAVMGNKMVRLDNPMLRAKLGNVGKAHAAAASTVLPRPLHEPDQGGHAS